MIRRAAMLARCLQRYAAADAAAAIVAILRA